ncbi:MAG: hypothetical protein JNM17_24355 [Archangium sp.]|nr:hypothetical protein [Archangium sp.]
MSAATANTSSSPLGEYVALSTALGRDTQALAAVEVDATIDRRDGVAARVAGPKHESENSRETS